MSVSIGSGSSRGRSLVRSGKRRRGTTPRSRSASSLSKLSRQDGNHSRFFPYPQNYSKFFDPFPATMRCMLRYSETFWMDPAAGATAHQLFRCGSIYDPNYSGTGHQPYGHDTYQTIYNHYRVIKADLKVTWTEVSNNCIVGVTLTDDASVNSTYETVREVKPSKSAVASIYQLPTLTMRYVATDVFGMDTGEKTTAIFGANPPDEVFFDIWGQSNLAITGNTGIIYGVANIVYYVECSELKDLGQS